jgi:hypothetical protein
MTRADFLWFIQGAQASRLHWYARGVRSQGNAFETRSQEQGNMRIEEPKPPLLPSVLAPPSLLQTDVRCAE